MTALPYLEVHNVFCAQCLEFRVQFPSYYLCAVCDDRPAPASWPPPRMHHDRDHISTTSGDL